MQHKEEFEIPARREVRVVKTTCDFCHNEIAPRSTYDASEVEIKLTEGDRYPDCGNLSFEKFDCCVACWKSKIKPMLISLGAVPRTEELDY